MFFSTGIVLFQSTVCSRCPSADFIAPVTMSQIGHVFGGFFRQTSIIYKWNMANNNVFKYYIFFGTDTWKSSTFKICIDNKWLTIFMLLFSQFNLLNMLFSVAVNRLGEIVSPVLLLSWSWLFHSLCALYWAVRVFQDFYAHMYVLFLFLVMMSILLAFVLVSQMPSRNASMQRRVGCCIGGTSLYKVMAWMWSVVEYCSQCRFQLISSLA